MEKRKQGRHGYGCLQRQAGRWKLRFYANIIQDGKPIRKRITTMLGRCSEQPRAAAEAEAHQFMTRVRAEGLLPSRRASCQSGKLYRWEARLITVP